MSHSPPSFKTVLWRITITYLLMGILWILLSDLLLSQRMEEPSQLIFWQILKGMGYVAVTTVLLWGLLRSQFRFLQTAQRHLQQSAIQYRLLFEMNPLPMVVIDRETQRFVAVNNAAVRTYGYSRERFLELAIADLQVEHSSPGFLSAGEFPQSYDETHQCRDSNLLQVRLTVSRLEGWDCSAFLMAIENLTLQRQTECALRRNEERLRLILQQMPVLLDAFDESGNIILWNRECERVTGYSSDEIVGNPDAMSRLYPDAAYLQTMQQLWQEKRNDYRHWEWEITCKDGTVRTIAWSNISEQVPIEGFHSWGIGIDVTAIKQVEKALRASEERFRQAIVQAPFPIILHAEDGEILQVNRVWTELTGYAQSEIPTVVDWTERAYGERKEIVRSQIDRLYELDQRLDEGEFAIATATGEQRIWDFSSAPLGRLPDGRRLVISMASDVTDRKQAEELLRNSEEHYRLLANNFPNGAVLLFDQALRYVLAEGSELAQTGFHKSLLEGKTIYELFSEDTCAVLEPLYLQALRGSASISEIPFNQQFYQVHCLPIKNEFGVIVSGMAVIQNVTERKQAELEIRQLNSALFQQNQDLEELVQQRTQELLTLFNTLPDYIFVIDREMRIQFCNDLLVQSAGASDRTEVTGKTIFECFSREQADYFAEQNRQVFETGIPLRIQEPFILPTKTLQVDTYKIPLKRSNGEVYALIGTSRDITELVEARQALSDRTAQLEMTNRELDSFSYSVSHDLRAPLRHIQGFVNALRDELVKIAAIAPAREGSGIQSHQHPAIARYLQIIEESSKKMGLLIDGLLTLSRMGRRPMELSTVALRPLVEQAIALVTSNPAQGAPPQFEILDLPMVEGDATLLQQVFTNLIDNAVKFSRDRTPPQIAIGSLPDDTIFIRDNGVGFNMAYVDQLFGSFQRLHSQQEFEGTGIGLAIVQRIINRHRGKIWVESAPNQGTTFYFQLS